MNSCSTRACAKVMHFLDFPCVQCQHYSQCPPQTAISHMACHVENGRDFQRYVTCSCVCVCVCGCAVCRMYLQTCLIMPLVPLNFNVQSDLANSLYNGTQQPKMHRCQHSIMMPCFSLRAISYGFSFKCFNLI